MKSQWIALLAVTVLASELGAGEAMASQPIVPHGGAAFGEQAYFVNIPSKFINADGSKLWLSYSHGWSHKKPNPAGSRYAWCLQEFRLLGKTAK